MRVLDPYTVNFFSSLIEGERNKAANKLLHHRSPDHSAYREQFAVHQKLRELGETIKQKVKDNEEFDDDDQQ